MNHHCNSMTVFLCVALGHLVTNPIAEARVVEDWPLEKLQQSADLICICKVTAIQEEANEGFLVGSSKQMRATLEIESILKGQPLLNLKRTSLVYYDYKSFEEGGPLGYVNGPSFIKLVVSDDQDKSMERDRIPVAQHYLMYLRHRKGGGFEPVSGQMDASFSVWKIDKTRKT